MEKSIGFLKAYLYSISLFMEKSIGFLKAYLYSFTLYTYKIHLKNCRKIRSYVTMHNGYGSTVIFKTIGTRMQL